LCNWLPGEYWDIESDELTELSDYCIFVEATESSVKIPDFHRIGKKKLLLVGSYYLDKSISRDYSRPVGEKPTKAKVFRYTDYILIEPEN
jgi:hypothetical protein